MTLSPELITATSFGISVLAIVWTSAKKTGNLEQTISQLGAQITPIAQELQRNTLATNELRVSMVGLDGSNGLRGELRELKQDVKNLRQSLDETSHHVHTIRSVLKNTLTEDE